MDTSDSTPAPQADDPTEDGAAPRGMTRRVALCSAGLVGGLAMATGLAACGGSGDTAGDASGAGSGAGGASTGGNGPVEAVAKSDVPVGSGIIDDSLQTVITQPTSGEFKAFDYLCTHQQCPVSQIEGDTIKCSCHGSEFSIKDGSVLQGPATKPLTPKQATVKGSQVVIS